MPRRYIDCRDYPSVSKCSITIAADNEDELLEAAVLHAKSVHGHEDSQEFRAQLRQSMKSGSPPS